MKTEEKNVDVEYYSVMKELKEYPRKHFLDIAIDIAQLLCRKNIDYGESFHETYKTYGDISVALRLNDKMNRLTSLVIKGETKALITNEGIEDTLKDIAGYAILALTSRKRIREESKE